jgi:aminomethyltransferase
MCKEDGGIIDDLIAYKIDREKALLVVNAANKDKDYEWLKEQAKKFNVNVIDRSDELALIAVQGPKAEELLQEMASIKLSEIGFYQFKGGRVRGIKAQISRTGYTGEDGFELLTTSDAAVPLWRSLLEYG